jgi:hypothetical protein
LVPLAALAHFFHRYPSRASDCPRPAQAEKNTDDMSEFFSCFKASPEPAKNFLVEGGLDDEDDQPLKKQAKVMVYKDHMHPHTLRTPNEWPSINANFDPTIFESAINFD